MVAAGVLFALGLIAAAVLGAGTVTVSRRLASRLVRAGDRLIDRVSVLPRLRKVMAALVVVVSGSLATVVVSWPIGLGLANLEDGVDRPVFDWMDRHLTRHSWFTRAAQRLTEIGNNRPSQILCVVAGVVLASWWWAKGRPEHRRVWWFPLAALIAMNVVEHFAQTFLAGAVDRGHPPATFGRTLGTYPSGGSARVVCIWGLVAVLIVATLRPQRRPIVAVALGGLVAVAAFVEGYTRTYLLKHWVSDVAGGWLFGAMLLAVFAAAVALVSRPLRLGTRRSEDRVDTGAEGRPT